MDMERSESLDMFETDLWRAMASYEFFLVCDGERLGITGASVESSVAGVDGIELLK